MSDTRKQNIKSRSSTRRAPWARPEVNRFRAGNAETSGGYNNEYGFS